MRISKKPNKSSVNFQPAVSPLPAQSLVVSILAAFVAFMDDCFAILFAGRERRGFLLSCCRTAATMQCVVNDPVENGVCHLATGLGRRPSHAGGRSPLAIHADVVDDEKSADLFSGSACSRAGSGWFPNRTRAVTDNASAHFKAG
ncbi:hypothetical protein [Mesorhizobium sp.]|uniref:hypothetical protein n=1 Tax=Mesorhizobium sp. TaxID=1871066 RepID=UPI0025BA5B28|nr:hypothetical protein [Mesorhizobium sp.]